MAVGGSSILLEDGFPALVYRLPVVQIILVQLIF